MKNYHLLIINQSRRALLSYLSTCHRALFWHLQSQILSRRVLGWENVKWKSVLYRVLDCPENCDSPSTMIRYSSESSNLPLTCELTFHLWGWEEEEEVRKIGWVECTCQRKLRTFKVENVSLNIDQHQGVEWVCVWVDGKSLTLWWMKISARKPQCCGDNNIVEVAGEGKRYEFCVIHANARKCRRDLSSINQHSYILASFWYLRDSHNTRECGDENEIIQAIFNELYSFALPSQEIGFGSAIYCNFAIKIQTLEDSCPFEFWSEIALNCAILRNCNPSTNPTTWINISEVWKCKNDELFYAQKFPLLLLVQTWSVRRELGEEKRVECLSSKSKYSTLHETSKLSRSGREMKWIREKSIRLLRLLLTNHYFIPMNWRCHCWRCRCLSSGFRCWFDERSSCCCRLNCCLWNICKQNSNFIN